MTIEELKQLALDCGFHHVGDLDADTIEMHVEARDACAENKCHSYGKNWNCPPGCGTLEECSERVHSYKRGVIVETTGTMEDAFDFECWEKLGKDHKVHFDKFAKEVRREFPGALVLGDGACSNCKECTYPDAPCRFPDRMTSSMEALGMLVLEVCKNNDLTYYYGPNTIAYTSCFLLK